MDNSTKCLRSDRETIFKVMSNSISACCKMYPGAKFYTNQLDDIRRDLSNGIKNSACSLCWKQESNGLTSWRMLGNKHYHDYPNKHQIEIYFDNTCDAACIYCSSLYSSKWQQELKNAIYNPPSEILLLNMEASKMTNNKDIASYSTYIFDYISNLAKTRNSEDYYEIVLLGGEPLLTTVNKKEVLVMTIDAFYSHSDPDAPLTIIIQTNGNTPKKLMDKFVKQMSDLKETYKNLNFIVSLSAESTGEIFEYIRYGCSYNTFVENLNRWASTGCDITTNLAVNAVSLSSLTSYLTLMCNVAKQFNIMVEVSVNMVHSSILSVGILDQHFCHYCDAAIAFVQENNNYFRHHHNIVNSLNNIKDTIGTSATKHSIQRFKEATIYFEKTRSLSIERVNPELSNYVEEMLKSHV